MFASAPPHSFLFPQHTQIKKLLHLYKIYYRDMKQEKKSFPTDPH